MHRPQGVQQIEGRAHGLQLVPVQDVDLNAPAHLAPVLGIRRFIAGGGIAHPGQPLLLGQLRHSGAVHPGRADEGKGHGGAAALVDGGHALEDAHTGIQQVGVCVGQAGGGQHPGNVGLIHVQPALPAQKRHYVQLHVHVELALHIPGKLAHGHSRADGQPVVAHHGVHIRGTDRALHLSAADGVHPVQHHQGLFDRGAGLHQVGQNVEVLIIADAGLLDVEHHHIHVLHHFRRGGGARFVEDAVHRQAGGGIHVKGHPLAGNKLAPDAENGVEQGGHSVPLTQDIHRGAAVPVDGGPGRHQANPLPLQKGVENIKTVDAAEYLGFHKRAPFH